MRTADGHAAQIELLRDFANGQPADVAHQQHRALTRRQMLQRRDERELGRLTPPRQRDQCG